VRLQTKLTVAFAAVALLPIASLTALARVVVADRYRGEFDRSLAEHDARVTDEYERLRADVEQAAARLANVDDRLLRPLLLHLANGPLDEDVARRVKAGAPAAMRALGLDIFEIVDERGEVLAAGHFAGRVGDSDPDALAAARRTPGRGRLVHDQILDGGRARDVLALEVAREVQGSFDGGKNPRVIVVCGRILGNAFMARLHSSARLYSADGQPLAARAPAPPKRWPRRVIELAGPDGMPAARVEIAVSNAELTSALEGISWAAGALAVSGVVLALLGGAVVARRISGPLRELSAGARAVARGSLDATVPVRTRDEVGELAATFNAMTRDLAGAREELVRAERVAAWREIAQRIAHEIKNPLTPIQMAIETLQRVHGRAKARPVADGDAAASSQFDALFAESAQTILDEVARLKHIVAEFSSFARMPQPKLAAVDVSDVVDAALALYKGGDTPIDLSLAHDLPPALADREQLTQVVINLVENARDAVRAGGRIRVSTRAGDNRIELEVADDGPGLSDEARAKLFTPYFTTKAKGTGLGLAIVHRIVRDHGGDIRVGGAAGNGAVFTVALPRAMQSPA
jgi:signal transduction histidine kinase